MPSSPDPDGSGAHAGADPGAAPDGSPAAGSPPATPEGFVAALATLGPQGRIPGQLLYAASALAAAGLDVDSVAAWATSQGGGELQAGAVKVRKGQRPEQGKVGRPEGFISVPERLIP